MERITSRLFLFALLSVGAFTHSARAAMEPFIGEMMMTAANFCPRGWADANGQLLPIAQNQALFSLLGTIYGGDGRTTFGLPDMRGRLAIHTGQGAGLTNRKQGDVGGAENHALTVNEMPEHTHNLMASKHSASNKSPSGRVLAKPRRNTYASSGSVSLTQMASSSLEATGSTQPHNNMPPFLTVRFCVALQGIYPSRN